MNNKATKNMDQIREHYIIEKELAHVLKHAKGNERLRLYSAVYKQILQRVPWHPHNIDNETNKSKTVSDEVRLLKKFLNNNYSFMEFGKGGYCQLSFEIAKYVKKVYATYPICFTEIPSEHKWPQNFVLIPPDAIKKDVPMGTIDIVFSDNLIEHLHPDDMADQLHDIYNVLSPGGMYICATPNRLMGPSDISQYFDVESTGFHLKEYTNSELRCFFKKAGFSKIKYLLRTKGLYISIPIYPSIIIEIFLNPFPHHLRRKLSRALPFRNFLPICLIAVK